MIHIDTLLAADELRRMKERGESHRSVRDFINDNLGGPRVPVRLIRFWRVKHIARR